MISSQFSAICDAFYIAFWSVLCIIIYQKSERRHYDSQWFETIFSLDRMIYGRKILIDSARLYFNRLFVLCKEIVLAAEVHLTLTIVPASRRAHQKS